MATQAAQLVVAALVLSACHSGADPVEDGYPPHRNVIATVFWVGEPATVDNGGIANDGSYWDGDWHQHFGGFDDPEHRTADGNRPAAFTPKENPFYFALPYGELTDGDAIKPDVTRVPWYGGQRVGRDRSILKNRWIEVSLGARTVYAQWEDVGPFGEDDADYVFGAAAPAESRSGLDLSPGPPADLRTAADLPALRDRARGAARPGGRLGQAAPDRHRSGPDRDGPAAAATVSAATEAGVEQRDQPGVALVDVLG